MWCSPRSGSAVRPVGSQMSGGRWPPGCSGRERAAPGGRGFGRGPRPVALQHARLIRELSPDAWLVNFTNPAGLVTQALRTVLGDRVVGICDSPIGLVRRACRAAGLDNGIAAEIDYVGINHLGWL